MPWLFGQTQTCDLSVEKQPPESGEFNQEKEDPLSLSLRKARQSTVSCFYLSVFSLAAWYRGDHELESLLLTLETTLPEPEGEFNLVN